MADQVGYWNLIFIGAMLLGAVMVWAILRNKKSSAASRERTEEGTRQVYRDEQRINENDPTSGL